MLIAQTEAEELPTVSVNPYFSFGPVTKAVSEMKQHLNEFSNEELVKVAKAGEEEEEEERLRSTPPRTMQMFTGFLCFYSQQNDLLPAGRVQKETVNKR